MAFSFGGLFGTLGLSSKALAPGGRLNAGRVSALAVDSRRGFGMQIKCDLLHRGIGKLWLQFEFFVDSKLVGVGILF